MGRSLTRLPFRGSTRYIVWVLVCVFGLGPENVYALYVEAQARALCAKAVAAGALGTTTTTTWTYGYDDSGNLTSRVASSNGASVTDLYHYNGENRLTKLRRDSGSGPVDQASYAYDADGIRKGSVDHVGSGSTTYFTDKNQPYAQVIEERSGAEVVRYTYGDDLIAQTRSTARFYYHYDGQMSVRLLTNSPADPVVTPAVVTDTYTFAAFGDLLHSTGQTVNNYLYTGEQYDPNVGFYYLRARYYDQAVGRFTVRDSIEASPFEPTTLHRYAYANLDPIDRVDPGGESSVSLVSSVAITAILFVLLSPNVANAPGSLDIVLPDRSEDLVGLGLGALVFAPVFSMGAHFVGRFVRGVFRLPPVQTVRHWNAWNGPGPLTAERAATFRGASYAEQTLSEPLTLYRVHGGGSRPLSNFWSRTRPMGPEQARIDLSLPSTNNAEFVTQIRVPAGTTIYEGAAAPQGHLIGEGNQVFIFEVDPAWVVTLP